MDEMDKVLAAIEEQAKQIRSAVEFMQVRKRSMQKIDFYKANLINKGKIAIQFHDDKGEVITSVVMGSDTAANSFGNFPRREEIVAKIVTCVSDYQAETLRTAHDLLMKNAKRITGD